MTPEIAPIHRLSRVAALHGPAGLGERLADLDRYLRADLRDLEAELASVPRGPKVVVRAAHHLLDLRGKMLRPSCVALASRFGAGFTDTARSFAVAVELVHTATLLHDDVVDVAERRRGAPTSATVYGNAASIFAGDWLLVAALRRISSTGHHELVDKMLSVIDEMILAESVQLERRGSLEATEDLRRHYFEVVEGKTAALFRWAMIAGGRAAGLSASQINALERYGFHLGVAFQAVDDELDFQQGTGKDPLADLREGKITYPLLVAIERDAAVRAMIEANEIDSIVRVVTTSGALVATRELAEEHVKRGLAMLDELPAGTAREALVTVALASLERAS